MVRAVTTARRTKDSGLPGGHSRSVRFLGYVAASVFLAAQAMMSERRRWLLSALALGVVSMLVFFLEGVNLWMLESATAYLEHSPGTVVVTQSGIDDLLFQQSSMPASTVGTLTQLPGVAKATPILTALGIANTSGARVPITLVGFDPAAGGGPWAVSAGRATPGPDEVIVDRGLASMAGVGLGGSLDLLGHRVRVAGESDGTNAAGDFFVFAPLALAQSMVGSPSVSYVFLTLVPGASATTVVSEVSSLPGVHALPRGVVSANDKAMIQGSFAQPVNVIAAVGLVAGVLIAAIVLLTAIVHHSRDYAVLKAIGGPPLVVYASTVLQAAVLSGVGIAIGLVLAIAFSAALASAYPIVSASFGPGMIVEVTGLIVVIDSIAALVPIRHIQRLDPQEVFKA